MAFRDIATAIGGQLEIPTTSVSPEDTNEYFTYLAFVVAFDNPTSSARTQELLDWHPVNPGLLEDLAKGHYFHG